MGASEEAYGKGHPATLDEWIDPETGDTVTRDSAERPKKMGQLSEQLDRFDPSVYHELPPTPEGPHDHNHGEHE